MAPIAQTRCLIPNWWQRFRWYHLSAFLAAMNLFTVVASLLLSHLLLNTYESSMQSDREWTKYVIKFEELIESVVRISAPGNDAFLSRDVVGERRKLKPAVSDYFERITRIRERISYDLPQSIADNIVGQLGVISRDVEVMQQGVIGALDLIEAGQDRDAGKAMSAANQHLSHALQGIRSLCQWTRNHRTAAIGDRYAEANSLRWIERCMGVLVVLLVLAIVVHGLKLAREMNESEIKRGRLSAIVEHSEDAILSEDLEGRITSWNAGATRLYGYEEVEVLGRRPAFLVPADRHREADSILREVRMGRPVQQVETIRCRKDGQLVDVELTISPVRNDKGELIGISQISRDIRELRASERAMQEAKEASEAANRTKSEFLANMSHEIRTPMTAILGFTDVLSSSVDKPDQIDAVETIRNNGEHLIHLINEILDLSKIEAGKLELERVQVSIPRLVADVMALMRVKADAKALSLKSEFPEPIPESILTDPNRLRQILINLIGNSLKFTEVGIVRLVVRLVRVPFESPKLQIEVTDTGIGMTAAQITRLFQPFHQADTSMSRKFGGTGLGLSICFRLAQILGGTITARSELNVGTTMCLTIGTGNLTGIPMIQPSVQLESPVRIPMSQVETPQHVGHILLAEDGPDNQRLIKYMLNKSGLNVTCCDNGVVAHELALERQANGNPFDLILMDMQMPVLDGYAATRQLRDDGYKGTIIALTAHAMSGDREKCLLAGCDDYITKPIERRNLMELVSRYLSLGSNAASANNLA